MRSARAAPIQHVIVRLSWPQSHRGAVWGQSSLINYTRLSGWGGETRAAESSATPQPARRLNPTPLRPCGGHPRGAQPSGGQPAAWTVQSPPSKHLASIPHHNCLGGSIINYHTTTVWLEPRAVESDAKASKESEAKASKDKISPHHDCLVGSVPHHDWLLETPGQ